MKTLGAILLIALLIVPPAEGETPKLHIVGAEGTTISLDTDTLNWQAVLLIEETAGQPVQDLELTVGALRGPDPGEIDVEWTVDGAQPADPIQMEMLEMIEVRLSARLPSVGVYKGMVSLRYADQRETYALTVERRAPVGALSIELDPLGPRQVWPVLTKRIDLDMTLEETAGRQVRVYPPTVDLSQIDDKDIERQAEEGHIEVLDAEGQALQLDEDGILVLAPYEIRALTVAVHKPPVAGHYRANVRVRSPDGTSQKSQASVHLRHSWLFALLFIVLGTVASLGLRWWLGSGRARSQQGIDLALLDERVERAVQSESKLGEHSLVQSYRARLTDVRGAVAAGLPVEAATVKDLQDRWPLIWQVYGLEQDIADLPTKDLADPVQESLVPVREALQGEGAEQLKAASQGLSTVRQELDEAQRVAHLRPFEELASALREYVPPGAPDAPIPQTLEDARRLAGQALLDAQAGKETEAEQAYNDARTAYLGMLIADLRGRLPEQEPPRVEATAWAETHGAVTRSLDQAQARLDEGELDQAGDLYEQAKQRLLQTFVPAIKARLDDWKTMIEEEQEDTSAENPKVVAAREAYGKAEPAVQRAQACLDKGDWSGALAAYDEGVRHLRAVSQALKDKGEVLDGEGATLAEGPFLSLGTSVLGALFVPRSRPEGVEPRLPSARAQQRRKHRGDLIATFVIAVLSGLIGLQLLWVDNSTFGSLNDYIGVLLWGFGLHQLGDSLRTAGPAAISRALASGTAEGQG